MSHELGCACDPCRVERRAWCTTCGHDDATPVAALEGCECLACGCGDCADTVKCESCRKRLLRVDALYDVDAETHWHRDCAPDGVLDRDARYDAESYAS